MGKIKCIVFDLGGIVFEIDKNQAIRHFEEIGFAQAKDYLDAFTQIGIFGDLESGKITAEQYRQELSVLIGHDVTLEQCRYAWTGYMKHLPLHNLDAIEDLRRRGYRVSLLSNTNPFMMSWANSSDFSKYHLPVSHYFDAMYLSYECGVMKPDQRIFEMMIEGEGFDPSEMIFIDDSPHNVKAAATLGINTLQPGNGEDWRPMLEAALAK